MLRMAAKWGPSVLFCMLNRYKMFAIDFSDASLGRTAVIPVAGVVEKPPQPRAWSPPGVGGRTPGAAAVVRLRIHTAK
jgi:hypothetical protein